MNTPWCVLEEMGISTHFVKLIKSLYIEINEIIKVDSHLSNDFKVQKDPDKSEFPPYIKNDTTETDIQKLGNSYVGIFI